MDLCPVRGGPTGFLKVIDSKTIGFVDFRGNIQYLSVGNINVEGRVAMISLDYRHRRCLKIWGTAMVVHAADDADLLAMLEIPGYQARVERRNLDRRESVRLELPPSTSHRVSRKLRCRQR